MEQGKDLMTEQDKEFITTLIGTLETKIDNIGALFQKDIDASNLRVTKIESRQDEFREDFRAIYPRLNTIEVKVKTLEDNSEKSSSWKSSVLSGVLVGVAVFIITYFIM